MPSEPLILGFDTSAAHCAAALLSGDRVLAQVAEPMAKGQAERLMPLLAELLAGAGADWGDLAALGVGTGPGNFTGVRLAVAAARGLALGLGVPAIGVNGFESLAAGRDGPLGLSLPAGRGQVHLCRWDAGAPGAALLCDPDEAPPDDWRGLDVLGEGAERLAAATGGRALAPRWPVAEAVARLAAARVHAPGPRPAPMYLRPADAALPAEPPPVILP